MTRDTRSTGLPLAAGVVILAAAAAGLAGGFPVGCSVAVVFLFAGPHNWLEARYVLGRLPARPGKLWGFFAVSAGGVVGLTAAFAAIPALAPFAPSADAPLLYAAWNAAFVLWAATLVWMRSRTNPRFDGGWVWGAAFALIALVLLEPLALNFALVYLHPLMALWLLDRELARSRPAWRPAYRASLACVPVLLFALWLQLGHAPNLPGDDPLTAAIAAHSGDWFLTGVSSHFLVAAHTFLETVHYGVWVLLIPLVGMRTAPWDVTAVPAARRGPGWGRGVAAVLAVGLAAVVLLWVCFLADYTTTRGVYFTVAMLHVLAEIPFLLRMV